MADDVPAVLPAPPLPELIQRYLAGESCQAIATELGKHRATIYRWMLDGQADTHYDQLVTHGLINRIAQADQKLDESLTACDIARAREQAKFARMDFERRRPKLYGPKQETSVDASLTIIVKRDPQHIDTQPVTIDGNVQLIDKAQ